MSEGSAGRGLETTPHSLPHPVHKEGPVPSLSSAIDQLRNPNQASAESSGDLLRRPRSVGEMITDAEKKSAFSGNFSVVPKEPDLGGVKSGKDLNEVIEGNVVAHTQTQTQLAEEQSARGLITGLKQELPSEIAEREAAAKELGFSAEHPMTPDSESVFEVAMAELENPQQPVNLMQIEAAPPGGGPPEWLGNPEFETNPERGRWLVSEVVRLRTTMTYEQRYALVDREGRRYLPWLYSQVQSYVNKISANRNGIDPWDRYERDEEGRITAIKGMRNEPVQVRYEEVTDANGQVTRIARGYIEGGEPHQVAPEPEQTQDPEIPNLDPLVQLANEYNDPNTEPERIEEVRRQLGKYFAEARRLNVLKRADEVLQTIVDDIQVLSPEQVSNSMGTKLAMARSAIENFYRPRRGDPDIRRLSGIGEIYTLFAEERFDDALGGFPPREYIEGEFRLDRTTDSEARRERYWEPSNYPKYYHVSARSPEQFQIAKETFFGMIRDGSLGKDPAEIYQHVENFKEAFGQRANEMKDAGVITVDFMTEQREELEGLLFIFGADYSNESYNPEQYKKFMTAMALHEGPARWVNVLRAGNGQVAAFTEIFDHEAVMEIFNNPVGERGELDIMAQHFVQDQVRNMVIERGMGIVLKDYDPANPDDPSREFNDAESQQLRTTQFRANLDQIGIVPAGDKLRALYDGFATGSTHTRNYDKYRSINEEEFKHLPATLQNSINLGRIQRELASIRQKIQTGQIRLERAGHTSLDFLSVEDRKIYLSAYDKSEANFEVAFQMQGASGEKIRRGKGFFYIERNPNLRVYDRAKQRSDNIAWLLNKLSTKKIEEFSADIQHFYHGLSEADKKPNEQGLYGIDLERMPAERRPRVDRTLRIGWMLAQMRDGRRFETFDDSDKNMFNNSNEEERTSYEDHMPTHLAEQAVQYVVTRTRIQYASAKASVRYEAVAHARKYAIDQIERNGWQTRFELPKILFDENGNVTGWDDHTKESVDLMSAAKHHYARYTTHTYWGYQGENRHMILRQDPDEAVDLLKAAKRIRSGKSKPEDEDPLALQLLIIDPTLKRVARMPNNIQREITLFQSAVEESFLNHVYITKDLFRAFLPVDGNRGKMRAGYNMEDWGGMSRFTMGIRELSATQPARFTRRLGAEIAIMPIHTDSMGAMWGQDGVYGAITMMADKIKNIGHQGVIGQFAITKFINIMDRAVHMYNALIGSVKDDGTHDEGLYMKPTNDNESENAFIKRLEDIEREPSAQIEFLQKLRATYGRLERVLKFMRPMYSDDRNAGGALRLEKVDIFDENGTFNTEIETNSIIAMNTGTSRHLISDFYDEFVEWLVSEWPGGGGEVYPDELPWNKFLQHGELYVWVGDPKSGASKKSKAFKAWFLDKAGL